MYANQCKCWMITLMNMFKWKFMNVLHSASLIEGPWREMDVMMCRKSIQIKRKKEPRFLIWPKLHMLIRRRLLADRLMIIPMRIRRSRASIEERRLNPRNKPVQKGKCISWWIVKIKREWSDLPKRPPTFAIKLVREILGDWVISVVSNLSK